MAVSKPFKKEFTSMGRTSMQTCVEVTCPMCGKVKVMKLYDLKRSPFGEHCGVKCFRKVPKKNTNWWEDAYNMDHQRFLIRPKSGGMDGIGKGFSGRHMSNQDGNFRGYDIIMNKAMKV